MTAQRDCDCITHDGPHWPYVDTLALRLSGQMLAGDVSTGMLLAFGREEEVRLSDLAFEMQRCGMAADETIAAFLKRSGWAREMIERCLGERDQARKAVAAALERVLEAAQQRGAQGRPQVQTDLVARGAGAAH